MTTINDLPGVTTIDNSDLIPLYQKRNRRTRNIAIEELRDFIYISVDGKYAPIEHVGSRGADQHAPVLAGGDAGFMSGSDKSKLDGIEEGAQVNVPANLSTTVGASTVTVNSDTGTDATIPAATTTDAGVMTAADKNKLDGIAAGAQVNEPTNLSMTSTSSSVTIISSTGDDVVIPAVSGTKAGWMLPYMFSKLAGVADNATANPNTDSLVEGVTNKYYTDARVRLAPMTGLAPVAGEAVATDSLLTAVSKLQTQATAAAAAIGDMAAALDAINGVVI